MAATFERSPDLLCGGRIMNGLPENVYSAASQIILDAVYTWHQTADAPRFFTTNNLSVSSEKFLECGSLNPLFRVSEDREFCDRWAHKGGSLQYVPEAIVYHRHHLSMAEFVRQHFNYGRGAFRFYSLRSRRGWGSLRIDPFFYTCLLRQSLKRSPGEAIPVLGAIAASQMANVGGYLWEWVRGQRPR
jgi:GT2 family glycosyltransferase